jgi:membrane protease subunit HflK
MIFNRMLWILGLVLFSALGLSSLVQVNQGERALLLRFGARVEPLLEPGLHLTLPLGMDRVFKVRVDSVQSVSLGDAIEEDSEANPAGRLVTGDQNLILTGLTLRYQPDGQNLWQYQLQSRIREELLRGEVESLLATWAAVRGVDQLLLEGRISLAGELTRRLREGPFEAELGIRILEITGARVGPPKEVQSSFDLVSRSEANRQTLVTKAQQDNQTALQQARSEAYRQKSSAQADAFASREMAKKDVERFELRLGALRENPDRASHFRRIWEEETSRILTRLKDQGRIGLLDGDLLGEAAELQLAPLIPTKPVP